MNTSQVRGKGRGKFLGFPTINLQIPDDFSADDGIYAAWVTIDGLKHPGALHYGPVPTFHDTQKSLEVFLLDVTESDLPAGMLTNVDMELVQKLRDVIAFPNQEALIEQMKKDVTEAVDILSLNPKS